MIMRTHKLWSVELDDLSSIELATKIDAWLNGNSARTIVTPNPEMLLRSRGRNGFRDLLNQSDLRLPDGVGLRFATAALTDGLLSNRHTGVDTLQLIVDRCGEGQRVVLLGGDPGSAQAAAKSFENTSVIGIDPGQLLFDGDRVDVSDDLVQRLQDLQPVVLAVGLGQEKQEMFVKQVKGALPSLRIAIGVGGAFEMLSGQLPRAPQAMRSMGLEWLWRVLKEPSRAGRIIRASVVFPAIVAMESIRRKRFLKAIRRVASEVKKQLFS